MSTKFALKMRCDRPFRGQHPVMTQGFLQGNRSSLSQGMLRSRDAEQPIFEQSLEDQVVALNAQSKTQLG